MNNSIVSIIEFVGDTEKEKHFEEKFNYLTLQSSLGIDETCKSISDYIEVFVDNQRFLLEGSQFKCMLNNDLSFSESTVDSLSEQRWANISRFMSDKSISKARYVKAVQFIKDRIVQEEAEIASPQTLASLSSKFAGTRFSGYFLKGFDYNS